MSTVRQPLIVISVFIWIGFVCAISFMEAWLKFRAEGVTLPIGLSVGRIVFNALNRVEWILAIVVIGCLWFGRKQFTAVPVLFFAGSITVLIIQTSWLLPALDARAERYIQQLPVNPSSLHLYFVSGEIIKVTGLLVFGLLNFKSLKKQEHGY